MNATSHPASRVLAWAGRILDGFGGRPAVEARRIGVRAPAVPAKGFVDPRQRKGTRRIAITFDDATFHEISAQAGAAGESFQRAARRLIEKGLHSDK